jgi:hypothetical protein
MQGEPRQMQLTQKVYLQNLEQFYVDRKINFSILNLIVNFIEKSENSLISIEKLIEQYFDIFHKINEKI